MSMKNKIDVQTVGKEQVVLFSSLIPDGFIDVRINESGKFLIKITGENVVESINDVQIPVNF